MKTPLSLLFFCFFGLTANPDYILKQDTIGEFRMLYLIEPSSEKTIGACSFNTNESCVDLHLLKIFDSEKRGKGLGSRLLKTVLSHAHAQNKPLQVVASPFQEDVNAYGKEGALQKIVAFYKKHGGKVNSESHICATIIFPPIII